MISLSLAFHLASAIAFFILAILYAKNRQQLLFVKRCFHEPNAIIIGSTCEIIERFCRVFGIHFIADVSQSKELTKLRIGSLIKLHSCWPIQEIRLETNQTISVHLAGGLESEIDPSLVKKIESDFSSKYTIKIIKPL